MDEPEQGRLFETTDSIEPPEPGLYLGTSGWSYSDWEGTVFPAGLPAGSRLAEYVRRYATVEIDSTFYGTPRRSTVERWREVAPDGFLFAAKFPQVLEYPKALTTLASSVSAAKLTLASRASSTSATLPRILRLAKR